MTVKRFDSYQFNPQVESSIGSEYGLSKSSNVLQYLDTFKLIKLAAFNKFYP